MYFLVILNSIISEPNFFDFWAQTLYKLKFYLSGQGWAVKGIQLFIMITLPGRTMLPPGERNSSFIINLGKPKPEFMKPFSL